MKVTKYAARFLSYSRPARGVLNFFPILSNHQNIYYVKVLPNTDR